MPAFAGMTTNCIRDLRPDAQKATLAFVTSISLIFRSLRWDDQALTMREGQPLGCPSTALLMCELVLRIARVRSNPDYSSACKRILHGCA